MLYFGLATVRVPWNTACPQGIFADHHRKQAFVHPDPQMNYAGDCHTVVLAYAAHRPRCSLFCHGPPDSEALQGTDLPILRRVNSQAQPVGSAGLPS